MFAATVVPLPAGADAFNGHADHRFSNMGSYQVIATGRGAGGDAMFPSTPPPGGFFRLITDDPEWKLPIDEWQARAWMPENTGLAMTLWHGDKPVYRNQGIEANATGSFYKAASDAQGRASVYTPGMSSFFSMSNNDDLICAGYFHLAHPVTFDRITGYFAAIDGFKPLSPRVAYRMNIWSAVPAKDGSGALQPGTDSFTGDVFSSDHVDGDFEVSETDVERSWTSLGDGETRIWRLTLTLSDPVTLDPGDYFFSHDAIFHRAGGYWSMSPLLAPFVIGGGSGSAGGWMPRLAKRDGLKGDDDDSGGGDDGGQDLIPEPSTLVLGLLGGGVAGIAALRRRYRRTSR